MRLENKVALITGAGMGIGRAEAILFAKEGAKVAVADIDRKMGEETVEIIRKNGGEALFIPVDVTTPSEMEKMVDTTVRSFGRLDVLVNNAGKSERTPLMETSEEQWDKLMALNVKSVFLGCKYAFPVMKKQGGGAIVNTSSTFAFVAFAEHSAYVTGKAAVAALTKAIALEVAPYKIRVNCICPGTTETPMILNWFKKQEKPEEARKAREKAYPLGRLGRPEDMAYAALYLACDESSFCTGTALLADGGYTSQ